MYAPQYYQAPQPMIPGFMQPMPIFQTPDHGQKRDLSPLIGSSAEQDGKRVRNNSNDLSSIVSPTGDDDENVSLRDIMKHLKKLATKDDLVQVKGSIIAQAAEIQQLKSELNNQQERLKVLEDQMGARTAADINRTERKPDVYVDSRKQYGRAHENSDPSQDRRKNIIIHGLKPVQEKEMVDVVLDMCQAMGSVIFSSDITEITRLGAYDVPTARPPPVRVTFEYVYQRNNMLRRKSKLAGKDRFAEIYINPDEPIEMRRIRGLFRRIAFKARAVGKDVVVRTDWIKIDEVTYLSTELDKIPREYQPDMGQRSTAKQSRENDKDGLGAVGGIPKRKDYGVTATGQGPEKPGEGLSLPGKSSPSPNVKIKLTKSGLTFSGPTAFPSNMSPADFVLEGQPYSSSEQGIQHLNAVFNNAPDIAAKILETENTKKIKEYSHDIPKSDEWKKIEPTRLWDLMDAKFTQNPTLMEQLLATAPHKLIEASVDGKWGGGGPPFGSDCYELGIVPGDNVFGEMATTYRNQKLVLRNLNQSV